MDGREFEIASFADYQEKMKEAFVILSSEERTKIIVEQVSSIANKLGLKAVLEKALLNEVTGLVEYPHILLGKIDQEFMQWLAENKIPFVLTFTKTDKLGKVSISKNIEGYKSEMLKEWEEIPKIFVTSAIKKTGLSKMAEYIDYLNNQFEKIN